MKALHVIAVAVAFLAVLVANADSQEKLKVNSKGVTAKILYEAPISGGR